MIPDDRTLSDQAIQWRVRLQADDVTADDLRAFEQWKNQSPRHRESYEEIDSLWHDLDNPAHQVWEDQEQGTDPVESLPAGTPLSWRRPALLAASVALVLLVGFWISTEIPILNPNMISVARGKHLIRTLPDGSTVHLNTNTTLEVAFSESERRIVLHEGEAWFTVKPDPTRPFDVEAAGGTIRAVGTEFNILQNEEETRVTVIEGAVKVMPSLQPGSAVQDPEVKTVTAGEQVRYRPGTGMDEVTPANLVQVSGWRHGQLVFNLEPLGNVVEEVDRYWSGKILVLDADLRDRQISGVFQTNDPDAVVRALVETFELESVKIAGYLYILYR
jgi:transmembrane sensor